MHRFQHAADTDAAGQVDVFADLGAGANGGPGIYHRAFIDVGADIDKRRHHDDIPADKAAASGDCRRHYPKAAFGEIVCRVVGEFGWHFVVELHVVTGRHHDVVFQSERQQYCFLDPLVDDPCAAVFLCNPQAAVVELFDDVRNGVANLCRS